MEPEQVAGIVKSLTKAQREAEKAERPVWADCPAFHHVWCHAPWTCKQPCLAVRSALAKENDRGE